MIKIEKTEVIGLEAAIRGMRNPMNSWDKSDSVFYDENGEYHTILGDSGPAPDGHDKSIAEVGPKDCELMMRLAKAGPVHGKFRRMIAVYVDITAPLYWWKEFDTYKVGTVANSCSTTHKIHDKEFTVDDFSCEHLNIRQSVDVLKETIEALNVFRNVYLNGGTLTYETGIHTTFKKKDKEVWWQMIQLLPSSYNQKRTIMLNYEVLANIYQYRRDHKLDEWRELCKWIEELPGSEIITCNA